MSDVLIVSCRLCLQPDEITSMVTIDRLLSANQQSVKFSICRPCARAIAAQLAELDDSNEQGVRKNAPARVDDDRGAGSDSPAAASGDSLVPEDQRPGDDSPVDRLESEVPAGGADGERAPEKG